jgi:hypothetical protein
MGCDWYGIDSISACGVIIDDNELMIEIKQKISDNMEYDMMLFRQSEGTQCFVYKKETETFISVGVPGPYEIIYDDNATKVVVNEKMTNLLKNEIKNMEEFLKIKECKYLSILTTFGMGKGFSSIQEYNDYYGYE